MGDAPTWLTTTLWPGTVAAASWRRGAAARLVAVPSAVAPTQLLPWRLASASAVSHRSSDDRHRLRSVADGAGVLGLLALAPVSSKRRLSLEGGDGHSLVDQLRGELDGSITSAVVLCGPVRANQKPVLQLHDRRGRTVAFAKVAWNALTDSLLERERRALEHLATVADRPFGAPTVLGAGRFGEGRWLAMSPVTVDRRRKRTAATTLDLARSIERTAEEWVGAAQTSPFVERLSAAAADLPLAAAAVRRLVEQHGALELRLRAAHGDFVPWNVLTGEPRTAVWDWERYEWSAPVGFDRMHDAFQVAIHRARRSTAVAAADVGVRLTDLVPELDARSARAHLDWYLADLLCRYEHDATLTNTASIAQRATEVAAVLDQRWRTT